MAFVVDASVNVPQAEFLAVIDFLYGVITEMNIFPKLSRSATVVFGAQAKLVYRLDDYDNR